MAYVYPVSVRRENETRRKMALVPFSPDGLFPMFHDATRTFSFANESIKIKQDWTKSGVAGVVWDAAVVLATYLQTLPNQGASNGRMDGDNLRGKRVLELGAGTGLVGIVSWLLGANVVITDTVEALNFTHENVKMNVNDSLRQNSCTVEALHWGRDMQKWQGTSWDLIIGADIVYVKETFPDLFDTLVLLTEANKETCVLLSCRIRYQRDIDFLSLLKEKFTVEEILYDKDYDVKLFRAQRIVHSK